MRNIDPNFDSYGRDRDQDPLTVWNGYPIYATTLLVVIHAGMLLFWMFASALHLGGLMDILTFHSVAVLRHGWIWQPLTYALVHPPAPAFMVVSLAIELYLLWNFGREVERFFGRRLFLQFYVGIWLLDPALHLLLGLLEPQVIMGSRSIHFAVFLAFATLYPRAVLCFGLTAQWIATILVAAQAIAYIAGNDYHYLLVFGIIVAASYYFVKYQKGEVTFPSFRFRMPRRKPKFHVVPRPAPPVQKVKLVRQTATADDVDDLLEKIARTGLNSLTAAEHARLERASAELKKRPEPH
jgi:membrane associated rhomboid family serine protease